MFYTYKNNNLENMKKDIIGDSSLLGQYFILKDGRQKYLLNA